MPREFFAELAVFTILEPMDLSKYKRRLLKKSAGAGKLSPRLLLLLLARVPGVKIEHGVVGSLEYKVIVAERADDLYAWLKENKYSYSGDEATLDFYVKQKWFFTVMKIDPMQMKRKDDGSYDGEVTPTPFASHPRS